jgi:hypothetical protein
MSIETMKLAFEALELCVEHGMFEQGSGVLHQSLDAITALRQAIKQAQKQEPVAHMYPCDLEEFKSREMCAYAYSIEYVSASKGETIPLYTSPPQRQPLTDEEIQALDYSGTRVEFVRAIEAAIWEKQK